LESESYIGMLRGIDPEAVKQVGVQHALQVRSVNGTVSVSATGTSGATLEPRRQAG
jgi:hypothetical protein